MKRKSARASEPEALREIREAREFIKRCLQKNVIFYLDVASNEVKMLAPQSLHQELIAEVGKHYARIRDELQHTALAWSFEMLGTPQLALSGAPCKRCGLPMRIGQEIKLTDGGWFILWFCDEGHKGGAVFRPWHIFLSNGVSK